MSRGGVCGRVGGTAGLSLPVLRQLLPLGGDCPVCPAGGRTNRALPGDLRGRIDPEVYPSGSRSKGTGLPGTARRRLHFLDARKSLRHPSRQTPEMPRLPLSLANYPRTTAPLPGKLEWRCTIVGAGAGAPAILLDLPGKCELFDRGIFVFRNIEGGNGGVGDYITRNSGFSGSEILHFGISPRTIFFPSVPYLFCNFCP